MTAELQCEDCLWIGLREDCIKKYRDVPLTEGDVEPYLECPECTSENLIELIDLGEEVLAPA